jgi:hypothetical protein
LPVLFVLSFRTEAEESAVACCCRRLCFCFFVFALFFGCHPSPQAEDLLLAVGLPFSLSSRRDLLCLGLLRYLPRKDRDDPLLEGGHSAAAKINSTKNPQKQRQNRLSSPTTTQIYQSKPLSG